MRYFGKVHLAIGNIQNDVLGSIQAPEELFQVCAVRFHPPDGIGIRAGEVHPAGCLVYSDIARVKPRAPLTSVQQQEGLHVSATKVGPHQPVGVWITPAGGAAPVHLSVGQVQPERAGETVNRIGKKLDPQRSVQIAAPYAGAGKWQIRIGIQVLGT